MRKRPRLSFLRLDQLESRALLSLPSNAPALPPPPPPGDNVVWVSTEPQLRDAVSNIQSGETIVLNPGTYNLSDALYLYPGSPVQNVTIRGATNNPDDVTLLGGGMDNPNAAPFGFDIGNVQNITIANLAIGQIYFSPIQIDGGSGADQVHIYNTHLFDAGEQFIKSNPGDNGVGAGNSSVEYTTIEYTNGPPVTDHGAYLGYWDGVDVLGGQNWNISNNLFLNLHYNLNYSILVWDNSSNATVEGNTFINDDIAVGFGLYQGDGVDDVTGGIISNNFIYQAPGLFSPDDTYGSDGVINIWGSPGTEVLNNSILTNGNTNYSIEGRFDTGGALIMNNLADAPLGTRDGSTYTDSNNYLGATPDMFVNPAAGDLHLVSNVATSTNVIGQGIGLPDVPYDWDGNPQPTAGAIDIGADQL